MLGSKKGSGSRRGPCWRTSHRRDRTWIASPRACIPRAEPVPVAAATDPRPNGIRVEPARPRIDGVHPGLGRSARDRQLATASDLAARAARLLLVLLLARIVRGVDVGHVERADRVDL